MTAKEISLTGGQMTPVARIGTSVHRATGPWAPAVHQLLRHLERVGFAGAPRVHGIDTNRREVLDFIPGEAGFFSPARVALANLWSNHVLVEAAQLLCRYHDATTSFHPDPALPWHGLYPNVTPHEVISHHDFTPYNCIFRDGHLYAVVDFDTAGPGPRVWDVAYAAYTFVPLGRDERCAAMGLAALPDRAGRLRWFCDAYGLATRGELLEWVQRRLAATITLVETQAAAGDARFRRKIAEGHVAGYRADLSFLAQHAAVLQHAIEDVTPDRRQEQTKPVAHIIVGFIGSGKTTFARKLEKETGAVRFTKDERMNGWCDSLATRRRQTPLPHTIRR